MSAQVVLCTWANSSKTEGWKWQQPGLGGRFVERQPPNVCSPDVLGHHGVYQGRLTASERAPAVFAPAGDRTTLRLVSIAVSHAVVLT